MHLPLESSGETIWAVVVGAVLATLGGFVATQLEAFVRRRERERSAALLFGEILSALETIAGIAGDSRGRGERYGSITLRLIRAAQREVETYERNRAVLYDLHDAEIRIRIHVLMVQLTLSLEGVLDASSRIARAQDAMEVQAADHPSLVSAQSRLDALMAERETAFDYTLTTSKEITSLVAALQPLAEVDFQALKQLSGDPFAD